MSNVFENIKPGATVYLREAASYGFNNNRYFNIPMTVTRATKTQFVCSNNKRYAKDTGREIGGGYNNTVRMGSKDVIDESKNMAEFKSRVAIILKATNLVYEMDKYRNKIDPDIDIEIVKEFVASADKFLTKVKRLLK